MVSDLRKKGLSDVEIAKGLGISTGDLRRAKSIAGAEQKQAFIGQAQKLKDKGYSNSAIGRRMNLNESSVRALLDPAAKDKAHILNATADMLKREVAKKTYLDVGTGTERNLPLPVSADKLKTAIAKLEDEGYKVHYVKVRQLGTGKDTTVKVLTTGDKTYGEVFRNRDNIRAVTEVTEDGGRSYFGILPPKSISSKRIGIKYGDEGGAEADGVIYVRPGVKDVSLGGNRYAQVRIAVDGTHFLKGMAMYKDDLPAGVDLMFNTNKTTRGSKLDVMKPMQKDRDGNVDKDNPFGAVISRQIGHSDPKTGKTRELTSVMNIVNEDANWSKWSKTLSSQFLSKQSPALAKQQLDMLRERKQREFDDIMKLTNPAVRRKLLEGLADDADSSAVHLKAAGLPGQRTQVILPVNSMKEHEVYAPNFRNGDRVALVRFPHGGTFEIPELTVNNRNPEARKLLGTNSQNAIGINHKVAQRLSGADFDGDTVLVIPNNKGHVKSQPPLAELKGFDPQTAYKGYPGMPKMKSSTKQTEMGLVSNLITDMTIKGASNAELARAVRHSMVVIDAEKHDLNYKQSAIDNGIAQLKAKYQGGPRGGASTIVSQRKSVDVVPERKATFKVDPATGKKIFVPTGNTRVVNGKTVPVTEKVRRLAEVDDAHKLSSGKRIEQVYADHSNAMKALANAARREAATTKPVAHLPSAKTPYQKEVASLNAKLNIALSNAPRERTAQVLANAIVRQKQHAYPDMDAATLKKIKGQALTEARVRAGAEKQRIDITPDEWKAIQAGAITSNKLRNILDNTDLDKVKTLAAPREKLLMTSTKTERARTMLALGYTQAEVADQLGVSLTTLKDSIE
jgi:DNA-binding CsgD family transcriptional regulator